MSDNFIERMVELGFKEEAAKRARNRAMDAIVMNDDLQEKVRTCIQCDLSQMCAGPIPGVGSVTAPLMLVGEAPGKEEDENDVPFVGDSGQLLTLFLNQLKVDRRTIYTTNAVKCRPPKNRQPHADELDACRDHLMNEIKWVRPKIIVTLGNPAMWQIRKDKNLKITKERGRWHKLAIGRRTYMVLHTFHPSFVLRKEDPAEFQAAARYLFNDLKAAFTALQQESEV
ncbi:Uracil DNA glycosylase superfamily protein [compost metagenome]